MNQDYHLIEINNLIYRISKDIDEDTKSFNIRAQYILNNKPKSHDELITQITESKKRYYQTYHKCKYN